MVDRVKVALRFLLRSKTLKLYRDILRTIKRIPNKEHQAELKSWVRRDFENNKHLTNEDAIKYNLNRGKSFYEELLSSLNLAVS
nr:LYR motif-containing protein 2 isoform X2 [Parasteatoda tepidariorum]